MNAKTWFPAFFVLNAAFSLYAQEEPEPYVAGRTTPPSVAFRSGPGVPNAIVVKTTGGTYDGDRTFGLDWLREERSFKDRVAASLEPAPHYLINQGGWIHQYLDPKDHRAQGAGYYDDRSIVIACVGWSNLQETWYPSVISSLTALVRYLCSKDFAPAQSGGLVPRSHPTESACYSTNELGQLQFTPLKSPGIVGIEQVSPVSSHKLGAYFPWKSFMTMVRILRTPVIALPYARTNAELRYFDGAADSTSEVRCSGAFATGLADPTNWSVRITHPATGTVICSTSFPHTPTSHAMAGGTVRTEVGSGNGLKLIFDTAVFQRHGLYQCLVRAQNTAGWSGAALSQFVVVRAVPPAPSVTRNYLDYRSGSYHGRVEWPSLQDDAVNEYEWRVWTRVPYAHGTEYSFTVVAHGSLTLSNTGNWISNSGNAVGTSSSLSFWFSRTYANESGHSVELRARNSQGWGPWSSGS